MTHGHEVLQMMEGKSYDSAKSLVEAIKRSISYIQTTSTGDATA